MMNYFKRAMTSMKRRPRQVFVLMLLVFTIGNLASGAFAIRQAIHNIDANLRIHLPAISTIDIDWVADQEYWDRYQRAPRHGQMTTEIIRELGNLPYVADYSYLIQATMYGKLEWAYAPFAITPEDSWLFEDAHWRDWRAQGSDFNKFYIRGISRPEIFEIQTGLLELVQGRLMTESELNSGASVVLISHELAINNELSIGSEITLINGRFQREYEGGEWGDIYTEENLLDEESVNLTIVGIFDLVGELEGDTWSINEQKVQIENRLYAPIAIAEEAAHFQINVEMSMLGRSEEDFNIEDFNLFTTMFLLVGPEYLSPFSEKAREILPEFYTTVDLSNAYDNIFASMETMLLIANSILWFTVGFSVVVVSLLIVLFFGNRKLEIGLYFALGEKKGRVLGQILIEAMLPAILAATLALFTGIVLSDVLSRQMLENELIAHYSVYWGNETQSMSGMGTRELQMYMPREMNVDQILALFDTFMDSRDVAFYFGFIILSIGLSVILSMIYVMHSIRKNMISCFSNSR